jgi:transposase-like protein
MNRPDHRIVLSYLKHLAKATHKHWTQTTEMLVEEKEDSLVYMTFPEEHHRLIYSVNPLEWRNREIRRSIRFVGVFPDRASVYRLVGSPLLNTYEDWRAGRLYMGKEGVEKNY